MDEIKLFLEGVLSKYPETWENIDEYIKYLLPHEHSDPLSSFKSKYYKKFVPVIDKKKGKKKNKVIYVPEELASKSDIKLNKILFGKYDNYLIDFKELFKDCGKNDFDVESWSDVRKDAILKEIYEFLFECNIHKGVFFFRSLSDVFAKIKDRLGNLEKLKPIYRENQNWLQVEVKEILKLEIESLKSILTNDFKSVYYDLDKVLSRVNSSSYIEKNSTFTWYKIAEVMANGYLEIVKNYYIINGRNVYIEAEASRLVSKQIYGNDSYFETLSPYLNQTKSNVYNDKNIFIHSRLNTLNFIAAEAEKNNVLSDYFKIKLSELNK